MTDTTAEAQVKGVTILGLIKLIKKRGSDQELERVLDQLPDEDRQLFDERILVSTWYPYRTFCNLLVAVDAVLGKGDGAYAREIGHISAEMDLTGVYRAILSFLSTGMVAKRALRAWGNYYSSGHWKVVEEERDGKNSLLRVRLMDFRTLDPIHCLNIMGWCEKLLELLDGSSIGARETACVHRGDPYCEFLLTWVQGQESVVE